MFSLMKLFLANLKTNYKTPLKKNKKKKSKADILYSSTD